MRKQLKSTTKEWLQTVFYLEALVRVSPVLASRTSQSRRIPFFPDALTQVSTWTTSPLQDKISPLLGISINPTRTSAKGSGAS